MDRHRDGTKPRSNLQTDSGARSTTVLANCGEAIGRPFCCKARCAQSWMCIHKCYLNKMILPVAFLVQVLDSAAVFFSVHSISQLLLMSRQFLYKDAEGNPWSLTIRGRRLLASTTHGTTFEADPAYLQRAWYQTPDGEWLVLENKEIHWKTALVYLATVLLPWWEDWIHHQYPRAQQKDLSASMHFRQT